jgi:phage protein D
MAEQPLTKDAVYIAVPTVRVDGQANDKVSSQLLSMEMREREAGMSSIELRFSNFGSFPGGLAGNVFEDGTVLKLGAALQVYAGDSSAPTEIFRGKIIALEAVYPKGGPPELVVISEDALQAARMKRRSKTWESATLAQIVQQVASSAGLTPVSGGLDGDIGTQEQFDESDLHFLRRLLARYDADLQVVGGELHASPRAQAQRNAIELEINSQLKEVRITADLAQQVTGVIVTGWDFKQGQAISATSGTSSIGPGSGKTGKQWMQQTLADRSHHIGRFATLNTGEAQSLADAEYAQRARQFVVAHGVTEGNPNLRVGSHLKLTGLGPRFSNTYYTTGALHRFDTTSGYETEFTAECAYLGDAA